MRLTMESLEMMGKTELVQSLTPSEVKAIWPKGYATFTREEITHLTMDYNSQQFSIEKVKEAAIWLLNMVYQYRRPPAFILGMLDNPQPSVRFLEPISVELATLCIIGFNQGWTTSELFDEAKLRLGINTKVSEELPYETVKKGNKSMDANITAFLSDNAVTVKVIFNLSISQLVIIEKQFTYITAEAVKVGDIVIVPAGDTFRVAEIVQVDETLKIRPDEDRKYLWLVAVVNFDNYQANLERLKALETTLDEAYQKNIKKSFAQNLLAGFDEDTRAAVLALTNVTPAAKTLTSPDQ